MTRHLQMRSAPQRKISGREWLVFLIGFMGAGKTTVGKVLAKRLGWKFYDLDQLIETREQRSIASIFAESGENTFRTIESAVLNELLEQQLKEDSAIVALGGGAFVHPHNRDVLQRAGVVTVLLSAPVEELARRCQSSGNMRPLAGDQRKFEQLFESRQEAYSLAQFRVETQGKPVQQVAKEIERLLKTSN